MTLHEPRGQTCPRCGGPVAPSSGFGRILNGKHLVCAHCGWVWSSTQLETSPITTPSQSDTSHEIEDQAEGSRDGGPQRRPVRRALVLYTIGALIICGAAAGYWLTLAMTMSMGLGDTPSTEREAADVADAKQTLELMAWLMKGVVVLWVLGISAIALWARHEDPQSPG